MAKSKNNVVMHGASGKIGDLLIFKTRFGKTIISKIPQRSEEDPTIPQTTVRETFRKAIAYAKSAMANQPLFDQYNEKAGQGIFAFNLAVADFFKSPKIEKLDTASYHGVAGDPLMIEANDDFKVNAVSVSITDANGNLVEQGNATQQGTSDDWFYLATVAHGPLPGTSITVKATDLAGNTTTKLEVLP